VALLLVRLDGRRVALALVLGVLLPATSRCAPTHSAHTPASTNTQNQGGVLPALQRLSYAGKHLDDAQRTLEQYGVAHWHAKFPHWPIKIRKRECGWVGGACGCGVGWGGCGGGKRRESASAASVVARFA